MDYKFTEHQSLTHFQGFINKIFDLPDDRLFSISDLVSNQERFTMRALKGIRKNDKRKLKYNLLIAFSWLMAVANRLHVNVEKTVWRRFPMHCSYCGRRPCACKKIRPLRRVKNIGRDLPKPKNLAGFQKMFNLIYPPSNRTLADAGIHLAEETGEVSEAVHIFLGEHKKNDFEDVTNEIADYASCILGVANSAKIDLAKELGRIYYRNCHVCHKVPCVCGFSFVAKFES